MDRRCRICRTTTNLKFGRKQVRERGKEERQNLKLIKKMQVPTTFGNICKSCDLKIQQDFEFSDDELNVDNAADNNNSSRPSGGGKDMIFDKVQPSIKAMPSLEAFSRTNDLKNWLVNYNNVVDRRITKEQQQSHDQEKLRCPSSMYNNHSLGSDGDTEIVEVLTSRESTPGSLTNEPLTGNFNGNNFTKAVPTNLPDVSLNNTSNVEMPHLKTPEKIKASSQPILETIDLSLDDDDISTKEQSSKDKDSSVTFSSSKKMIGRKRRKTYNEKEQRVVGTFNLVSSDDSESELPPLTHFTPPASLNFNRYENNTENLSLTPKRKSVDIYPSALNKQISEMVSQKEQDSTEHNDKELNKEALDSSNQCKHCNIRFSNAEDLATHQRVHEGFQCKLCTLSLPTNLRLVSHMRHKHRQRRDDILCEQPRNTYDSALTIRLRYLERYNYYECHICGNIDELFVKHTAHIKEFHANELKMLKDPVSPSASLQCSLCKFKTNKQAIELVKHLVETHEYWEYRKQLKIVNKVYDVQEVAVVYELQDTKKFFFKCKRCCHVVSGFLSHKKHQTEHKIQQERESTSPNVESQGTNTQLQKLRRDPRTEKTQKEIKQKSESKTRNSPRDRSTQSKSDIKSKNQKIKPKPINVKLNKVQSSHKSAIKKTLKKLSNTKINKKNSQSGNKENASEASNVHAQMQVNASSCSIAKKCVKPKSNAAHKKLNKQFGGQIVKVKVKRPVRQLPTQKFACNLCNKVFKGFIKLNIHKLQACKIEEFPTCSNCKMTFLNLTALNNHNRVCLKQTPKKTTLNDSNEKSSIGNHDNQEDEYESNAMTSEEKDANINKRKRKRTTATVVSNQSNESKLKEPENGQTCPPLNNDDNALKSNSDEPEPIDFIKELIAMAVKRGRIKPADIEQTTIANKDNNDNNEAATETTDHQNSLVKNTRLASEAKIPQINMYSSSLCHTCGDLVCDTDLVLHRQQHEQHQKQNDDVQVSRVIGAIPLTMLP